MRLYNQPHRFYCGVDLHARTMSLDILDQAGTVVLARTLPCEPRAFLDAIAPFRDDLVVCCECLFCWYWLADLCAQEKIAFVLGHALYMRLIHGGKTKNDPLDAHKIAVLLRGGMIPQAYVYPKGMRETRDLLRRRMYLVHKRAETITHLVNTNSQYNLPPFPKKLGYAANRAELNVAERFTDPSVKKTAEIDLALLDHYDALLGDVELYLTRTAKVDDPQAFARLQSIPGVGKVLALVLLYEIHDIGRFQNVGQFLSYARLVRCQHESAGKKQNPSGKRQKIGNAHLRWAFAEAACLFLRASPRAKQWKQRQQKKRGEGKALAILAAKLGRAVYHLLRKGEVFDEERFWGTKVPAMAGR
jgi:transposase